MKKLLPSIALILFSFLSSFAQEKDSNDINNKDGKFTLSAELSLLVGANYGLNLETLQKKNKLFPKLSQSDIFKVYYISSTLDVDYSINSDVTGNGWGAEVGSRTYFNENTNKGFFIGGYILSGSIKYQGDINILAGGVEEFKGTYTYFSFFSPEVGYKFLISEKVAIGLHAGTAWLIEVKGKGDVDNKNFDNWVGRAGLSIGYKF